MALNFSTVSQTLAEALQNATHAVAASHAGASVRVRAEVFVDGPGPLDASVTIEATARIEGGVHGPEVRSFSLQVLPPRFGAAATQPVAGGA